jgi:hypothetical protein
MHGRMRTGAAALAAAAFIGVVGFAAPALAQEDTLNCGDAGTFHNMPVEPDDPHGLDGPPGPTTTGIPGIGCEDESVFGDPAPETPSEPEPTEPAPSNPAPESPAAPATPVVRAPTFTG